MVELDSGGPPVHSHQLVYSRFGPLVNLVPTIEEEVASLQTANRRVAVVEQAAKPGPAVIGTALDQPAAPRTERGKEKGRAQVEESLPTGRKRPLPQQHTTNRAKSGNIGHD